MEFRILGPLEVRSELGATALGGSKPRAILAMLLLHANEPVTAERLALALWGSEAPAGAAKRVAVHVSRLRKALRDPEVLVTTAGGYRLRVRPGELDAERFERLADDGRRLLAAGDPERAAALLREALGLWRGPPLADLGFEPFAQAEITRFEEQRLTVCELQIEAELAAGRHAALVGELQRLVAANPTRERLAGQLMLALYRCRRQAEALAVYRETRRRLVEDLGLEPSEELRRLEQQMLAQAPELELPAAAPPPRANGRLALGGARRIVTVVRAGLVDAPALAARLDPEALHDRLARSWDRCSTVIEQHGGTVERVADDAIVGLFGLTERHENDALRAARAATELLEAVDMDLSVGIATGEVFAGAGSGGAAFTAGEPVMNAGLLQRAAAVGEIRLDAVTQHAVEAEGAPTAATPFVGRAHELDALRSALARATAGAACQLVTVVGPPGIGKSRLARELLAELGESVTGVVGHCPAYGEAVTYRALAEIVRRLEDDLPADERVVRLVLAAVGRAAEPGRADETFWAFRRLFEAAARRRPVVVVVEDVHWAEPTLLDLLEYLVAFSAGSPILLLCLARPELLELRPSWTAPRPEHTLIALEGLSPAQARALVASLGSGEPAPIVKRAEGNPLFLEQLTAVRAEAGDAPLPGSIRAVLDARIDRLDPAERRLLSHGAVEGRTFHAGALAELLPEADLAKHLVSLVRKRLIRPGPPELAGDDAFRFEHALIREAAYDGLPKRERAGLHERVARWLARRSDARDEIVGYHLEQAYRYRASLAAVTDRERALATEGAQRLAAAARASLVRGDLPAAALLLERAVALLAVDDAARTALLPALGVALLEGGRLADARRVLAEAIARAEEQQDVRLAARAEVEQQFLRLHTEPEAKLGEARVVAERAARVLAQHGDEYGQCRVWRLRAWVEWTESRAAAADAAWRRAAEHADRAGDERELLEILGWRASAAAFGPTPVPEAVRRCTAIRARVRSSPVAEAVTLRPLALLHALQGEFDEARELIRRANSILDELGRMQSTVSHHEAAVEMLAGRPEEAERRLRAGYAKLEAMGERALLASTAAMLADAVYAQGGREDEAEELCRASERYAAPDDSAAHALWREVLARILAARGELVDAEELAREAVAIAAPTDALHEHGDALVALAEVLEQRGRVENAAAALREALELYERKGALVLVERLRGRLSYAQATIQRR